MKKSLYLFASLVVVFWGCSKNNRENPSVQKQFHKVSFNIDNTNFNISTGPITHKAGNTKSLSETDFSNYEFAYTLFNISGEIVSAYRSSSNYTDVVDSLPNGNYTATFFVQFNYPQNRMPNSNLVPLSSRNDVLSNKVNFTVAGDNLNRSVTLNRVVAKLELRLLDDSIPSNISEIYLSYKDSTSFNLLTQKYSGYALVNSASNYGSIQNGVNNIAKTMSIYTANNIKPFDVSIVAKYRGSTQIYTKVVNNVVCERNKITILSGKLFSTSGNAGIGVSVPVAWAPADTVKF